jgi:hypothetical protein
MQARNVQHGSSPYVHANGKSRPKISPSLEDLQQGIISHSTAHIQGQSILRPHFEELIMHCLLYCESNCKPSSTVELEALGWQLLPCTLKRNARLDFRSMIYGG